MIPKEQLRKTEVRQPDGSWVEAHFSQIEPGDVFRQFEPNSEPVMYAGTHEFTAKSHVVIEVVDV